MEGVYGKIRALTARGDNALVKAGRRTEAMNAYLHASRLDPDSPAVEALALWRGIMDFYCKDMYNP